MTRKQAQHLADRIVNLARVQAAHKEPDWRSVTFGLLPEMQKKLDANVGLVFSCMPSGWNMLGRVGSGRLTITRTMEASKR